MSYIVNLRDALDSALCGNKASNLSKIMASGLNVPKGWVLTTAAFDDTIAYNDGTNETSPLLERFDFPALVLNELKLTITNLGTKRVVVRSSSTNEDSPLLSFAGNYLSFLNISGEKAILDAIRSCYLSLFGESAYVFGKAPRTSGGDAWKMAVIIQEVAEVKLSGVLFTINPVTGNKDCFIVELTEHLGDKMASGETEPKHYEISRKDGVATTIRRDLQLGGVKKIPLFFKTLARAAEKLEKIFGAPQDIEWGIKGRMLFIFQSRPITQKTKRGVLGKALKFSTQKPLVRGLVGNIGIAMGKVFVVHNKSSLGLLTREGIGGKIIYIQKMDPALIPLIKAAAGTIIRGGILSHPAIISRELNKPCLTRVNIKKEQIHNKEVVLDSVNGVIYLKNPTTK